MKINKLIQEVEHFQERVSKINIASLPTADMLALQDHWDAVRRLIDDLPEHTGDSEDRVNTHGNLEDEGKK